MCGPNSRAKIVHYKSREEIASNEEKLKELKDDLQKKAMILNKETLNEKEAELRKEAEDFQRFFFQGGFLHFIQLVHGIVHLRIGETVHSQWFAIHDSDNRITTVGGSFGGFCKDMRRD